MRNSTALPDLRMLPVKSLLPHEDYDPRRARRLGQRILEEGILKNPPIVAPIPNSDEYVVLDGANRTEAFAAISAKHIVAQVVDYANPNLILDTWNHVVANFPIDEFENKIQAIDSFSLQKCSLKDARRSLFTGESLAYLISDEGVRKVLYNDGKDKDDKIHLLVELVSVYKGHADIYRASNDIWEIQKPYYENVAALIVFPKLVPHEIIQAALGKYKVPSGITRHIIPARAVNINIPVGILMTDWTIERKNEWLKEWVLGRMAANAIRFYAEPTFTYNE